MLKITSLCLCAMALTPSLVAQQQSGARSTGMGGTGVASSSYLESALHNPALLTRFENEDDWGLLLPTLSISLADPDSLADALEDFESSFDALEAVFDGGGAPTQAQLDTLADNFVALDGRNLRVGGHGGFVIAIPSKGFSSALVIDGLLDAHGFLDIDLTDEAAIRGALSGGSLPAIGSSARVLGAAVTEVKLAFAREFEVANMPLSIGITPKFQQIDVINYSISIEDSGGLENDFDDDQFRTDDTALNLDLGVSLKPHENWMLGLVLRDALGPEVDTLNIGGGAFTYQLEPVLVFGAEWRGDALSIAADLDLTSSDPFSTNQDTQFLRVGTEYAWEWAQLRAGYSTDLESRAEDLMTAGIGFSPFGVGRIELAGGFGENSYAVALSVGFTF